MYPQDHDSASDQFERDAYPERASSHDDAGPSGRPGGYNGDAQPVMPWRRPPDAPRGVSPREREGRPGHGSGDDGDDGGGAQSDGGFSDGGSSAAGAVVGRFYERYNAGDIDGVMECFADGVVYHDAIYLEPFFGKAALRAYFEEFSSYAGLSTLDFEIRDVVTDEESCAVAWQLGVDGGFFPFSRGVSFYKVDPSGHIFWGRDCVEAAPPKPGGSTAPLLDALLPAIRKVGVARADPAQLSELPVAAALMWAFYAAYFAYIMLSTAAPGEPAYNVDPRTLQEVYHHSLNFFYVNIGLDQLGAAPVPSVPENPVGEALFNFVNAWSLLFLPVLATDRRTRRVRRWPLQFAGVMLLTNVFFIPLLAQRAAPLPHPSGLSSAERTAASLSPHFARCAAGQLAAANAEEARIAEGVQRAVERWRLAGRALGAVCLFVGGMSVAWFALARPEYGGLETRLHVLVERFTEERVFYAFVVDAGLYAVWQAWVMSAVGAPRRYCAVPFVGQAVWLIQGRPGK